MIPYIFTFCFLFYFPLKGNVLFDFHPITFALPFLIFFGFSISLIAMFVLVPTFRGEDSDTLARYAHLGADKSEILRNLITNPGIFFNTIFNKEKIIYVIRLLLPLSFLSLFSPKRFLVILPSLLVNMLSNSHPQYSANFHYDVMTSVVIFWSATAGLNELFGLYKNRLNKLKINTASIILTALTVVNFVLFLGHPLWRDVFPKQDRSSDFQQIENLKTEIIQENPEAIICATNKPGVHFAEFRNLYYCPEDVWRERRVIPDYVLIDKLDSYATLDASFIDSVKSETDTEYETVISTPSLEVYKRL